MEQFLYYICLLVWWKERKATTKGANKSSGSTDILYHFIKSIFVKSFYYHFSLTNTEQLFKKGHPPHVFLCWYSVFQFLHMVVCDRSSWNAAVCCYSRECAPNKCPPVVLNKVTKISNAELAAT